MRIDDGLRFLGSSSALGELAGLGGSGGNCSVSLGRVGELGWLVPNIGVSLV